MPSSVFVLNCILYQVHAQNFCLRVHLFQPEVSIAFTSFYLFYFFM